MKFYGKAESIANEVLAKFESGEVPEALAQVFIHRKDNVPCRDWSHNNQLIMAFSLTSDARGFKQWQEAGRKVKKGSKAFNILAPVIVKREAEDKDTGEKKEKSILVGFRSLPVFKIEDTEIFDPELWEQAKKLDEQAENWLTTLPLYQVAKEWGLDVGSYNGEGKQALGYYAHNLKIAVGVENLSTWAHELVHAADDRNGNLGNIFSYDKQQAEIVAELGGAVLLCALGFDREADLGGAWQYIKAYSSDNKGKALSCAMALIKRTCEAVSLILDTAEGLKLEEINEVEAA